MESTPTSTEPAADSSAKPPTAEELKQLGNQCVRNANFAEAILHYSHAIKINGVDPILYSNRSLAFLKLKQIYYANEDADRTIELKPDWVKGHFRKAEALCSAGSYDMALLSYGRALRLQPSDTVIIQSAKSCASLCNQDAMYETRLPWVGAGIGIIIGVIIVLSDQLLTKKPAVKNPGLMVLMVIVIAGIGYGIARIYRYFVKQQRRGHLEPPVDLLEDFRKPNPDEEEGMQDSSPASRTRYTKAQARQRFKKGKT